MLTFSKDPNVAEQQMNALIVYLVAFGYIDGDFDQSEKTYIRDFIRQLVEKRAQDSGQQVTPEVIDRVVQHFHEAFEQVDAQTRELFDEVVAEGESVEEYVYAKLKLRSYEIFRSFDKANRQALLETAEALIAADGQVHPNEAKFRDEVRALLDKPAVPPPVPKRRSIAPEADIEIKSPAPKIVAADNHPFFGPHERHYSADPKVIAQQAADDRALMGKAMLKLRTQRVEGQGKLAGKQSVDDLAGEAPFLDDYTYFHPTPKDQEIDVTVLGDLHGCYSCLKAAVLQSNFFAKLEAFKLDSVKNPKPLLVLLGDYIDRGRFSYNGVLRTAMELYLAAPEHVYMLRGNHEYYVELRGRVYGAVRPAEAIQTLEGHAPSEIFEAYMKLFESLPNMLLLGRTLFVHAGIPRDADVREKWTDLSSLNDWDLRFQMMWSDPSEADVIPDELQAQNARFPFGRKQFDSFLGRLGCDMLVRGHEKIIEGFKTVYSGDTKLLSVFSAGGKTNDDLPENSSYREVKPMALTMSIKGDSVKVSPWAIDYEAFNSPERNAFFATQPEIEHKTA